VHISNLLTKLALYYNHTTITSAFFKQNQSKPYLGDFLQISAKYKLHFEIHREVGGYLGEQLHGEIWERGWLEHRIAGRRRKRRERGGGVREERREEEEERPMLNHYR
jgi:hypothetical protein